VSNPLVRVEDVSFSYPGEPPVAALRDVSLSIHPGELLALVGSNGSGKTTLARHLNGLLKPDSGRVLLGATDTRAAPVGELARFVGYVFQNPDHQLFLPTVRSEIAYGPERLGVSGAVLEELVEDVLARFDLTEIADHHPAMLGRGLRRLTALAAVAAMEPRVLVLDEPTGGLDHRLTERLMATLHRVVDAGAAVVLITHEMSLVAAHAQRVIVLRDGRVMADAPPIDLFDRAVILHEAGLQAPDSAGLAGDLRPDGMPAGILTTDAFCLAYASLLGDQS
jgi:energy-coupling factor transport system ATP-binding protein